MERGAVDLGNDRTAFRAVELMKLCGGFQKLQDLGASVERPIFKLVGGNHGPNASIMLGTEEPIPQPTSTSVATSTSHRSRDRPLLHSQAIHNPIADPRRRPCSKIR